MTPLIWNILPSVCCFVTNISPYFPLFPAIFVFYHTGFFVFIEKDQFAFSPPVCYTVSIYFRNYFFIYRKAYNL